jgi:hypothetical protein
MASKVDICNRALSYLGAQLITSFDEKTKSAEFCRLFYTDVLESMLRSHPWNFATTRVTLNQVPYETSTGEVAYQLPANCLRPLCNAINEKIRYDIEGRLLLTYENTFVLKYVYLEEDVNQYDTMFRKEFAQELAIELAPSITNSTSKKQELKADFAEQRAFTQHVDSQDDNEVNYLMDGEMLNVRHQGTGRIGPVVP